VTSTPDNWGKAFAKQAVADFEAWNELQGKPSIPSCQKLHFLQMSCEKLCKTHLCKQPKADPKAFQASHAYIAKNLDIIIRQELTLTPNPPRNYRYLIACCKPIAREIELLHPQVEDGGRRPDNCEYPWEQGGRLYVPAEYTFASLNLLETPGGRCLLKLIGNAIRRQAAAA
jgi:hypothetical protein